VKVQLFFSFSFFDEKKNQSKNFRFSFFFIFVSNTQNKQEKFSLNADVLSHVREFTVHREEEEDRGGGV
tara:strand:+ start:3090 stop:3296 length:207 start_codon:yes stop_codon:yes gene_type:complete